MKNISVFLGTFFVISVLYFVFPYKVHAQSASCGDFGSACVFDGPPALNPCQQGAGEADVAHNCFPGGTCTDVNCPPETCRVENVGATQIATCTIDTCEPASTVAHVNYDLNNNGINDPVCTTFEYCADPLCTFMFGSITCVGESPASGVQVTQTNSNGTATVTTDTNGDAVFPGFSGGSSSWSNFFSGTSYRYAVSSIPGYTAVPSYRDAVQPACGAANVDFVLQNNAYTGLGPQTGTHTGRVFIDNDANGVFLPNEPYTDTNGNGTWDRVCTFSFFGFCLNWSEEPFTDQNGNGTHDAGPDALYTARPYIYLTNPNNGQSTSSRANSSGVYSIQRFNANYTLNIIAPAGYSLTTTNPVSIVGGNPQVVDFGIRGAVPTLCPSGDLIANPGTIYANETSNLSLINCITPTPAGPTPTPNPTVTPIVVRWLPPICGTMPNPNTGEVTNIFTAPPAVGICAPQVCRVEVEATQGSDSVTFSEDITVRNRDVIQGTIYQDTNNDNCSTLSSDSGVSVELWEGNNGILLTSDTSDSLGGYQVFNEQSLCSDLTIILPGKEIKQVRVNGGAWTPESGNDYNLTLSTNPQTVDFCLESIASWFQVTTGDVRFNNLVNQVPQDAVGALGNTLGNFPGIYIASNFLFTSGKTVSTDNWKVENEYLYNKGFAAGKGSMAYSFYESKARQLGVSIQDIPDTTGLNGLPSGIYKVPADTIISNNISFNPGRHIILLVDGNITINANITAASGNGRLFVLAAKGNITINPDVGTTVSSTTTQLEGYYTAEGNITLESKANCSGATPDERLNVGGALIANALNPLSDSGSGRIVNNRTLCSDDTVYPSLYIATRPDFITQLTDFYKTTYKAFREVEP